MISTINLKMLRVKYDLTQENMAKLLGISSVAYRQKENNIRPFTLPEAKFLSEHFKMPIESIFFADEVHINGTPA